MANYNVDIIYNGSGSLPGTETLRIDGSANVLVNRTSTLNSSKFAVTGNTWHQNGLAVFSNPGNGESYPNITATAMMLGPYSTRSGTAGKYLAGIGFDHLLNYSTEGNMTYNQSPHGWIGLRTETFPGYETSSLVFATRSDTSGAANSTIERMCITSNGDIQFGYNSTSTVLIGRSFATAHANGNRGGTLKYGIDDGSFGGMIVYNVASGASGYNSQFIAFNTHEGAVSAAERMRITSTGNVGIGTTSPESIFHISTTSSSLLRLTRSSNVVGIELAGGASGGWGLYDYARSAYDIWMTNGNVGIGTTAPFGTTANRTCVSVNGTTDVSLNVGTGGSQRAYLYASASLGQVGTIGAIPLILATNDNEKVRITSDGNVGIGTTNPGYKLDIAGNVRIASSSIAGTLYFGSDSTDISIYRDNNYDFVIQQNASSGSIISLAGAGNVQLCMDSNNNETDRKISFMKNAVKNGTEVGSINEDGILILYGITGSLEMIPSTGSTAAEIRSGASNGIIFKANNSSVAQISSSGIISSSNITAYGSPSDRKLKENIEPLTNSLQKVMALQGVSFNWKKDTKEHTMVGLNKDIGLIAQNVQQVLPDLVREEEDGTLSLRDRGLVAVLIEAIKEQQSEIDELKVLVRQLLAK